MKTKLSGRFWCALTLFSLIGQVAWVVENMYLNVFIYKMFRATAADISLMVGASAVAATLTTVFIGALSDRIGKRKLFICGGYILWGVSIFGFSLLNLQNISAILPATLSAATVGVSLTIILDCLMTFFGSSANDAAFNAWLTDSTDSTNRGAAEGINAMMPLVAILAVFGGFMAFDLNQEGSWSVIFTIIGCVVTAVGILGLFLIKEKPLAPSTTGYWRNVFYGFLPSTLKQNAALYFHLGLFVLFNIAIQIFMPYLILYYEVSLGMADYVLVMAPAILLASVVTALWGKIYDKKGFFFSSGFALLWLCLGFILLFFLRSKLPVFIGSLFMMCGYLSGMAVFGAKIRDLTPSGKAGMLQGVRIFAQVLVPGIVGPYIGKTVLKNAPTVLNNDGTTSFVPTANIFLAALLVALVVVLFLLWAAKNQKPRTRHLTTPFTPDWSEYPRPQFKRDSYLCLNGLWNLQLRQGKKSEDLGEILVPYPPESLLSGVGRTLKKNQSFVYSRTFSLPQDFVGKRVLLQFGAVDQICEVQVNGVFAGSHIGGYIPFTLDVTHLLVEGENRLTVEVQDPLDRDIPYGKQCKKRGGMWYTPTCGIWQTVWMESVPEEYISDLKILPTLEGVTLKVTGGKPQKQVTVQTPEGPVTHRFQGETFTLTLENPRLWSPEDPYLYTFTLSDGEDVVESYFALRTFTAQRRGDRSFLCLNGQPYFCHGLLDQGYYSDGIYLPASPEGFRFDILEMKKQGFNTLRKHIKIEPDLFYYYCDKYGMLVFQDMVNNGGYSFLLDTALPTLGLKKGITHRATARRQAQFLQTANYTVQHLFNHPCVCYYTIFNEGWGQFKADEVYQKLQPLDPSRVWDTTSGWFFEQNSDVDSHHVYFKKIDLAVNPQRPLVLSEFGGYVCKLQDHSFNLSKTYGYKLCATPEALTADLEALYEQQIIPQIEKGLCATVLTQVSDVEDETNGLLTYDRRVTKTDPARMSALAEKLKTAFAKQFKNK